MPSVQPIPTADICDRNPPGLIVAQENFRDFGGARIFAGAIATIRCLNDNSKVREVLSTAGDGRVLVIDGDGSRHCALLGDNIAQLACDNDWSGVVINGCVRDSGELSQFSIGIKALATSPRRSEKRGTGETDVPLYFAGAVFTPGQFLYADSDGIVITEQAL